MTILAKPHAFDSTEFTQIYDEDLIQANKAAVEDRLHRVDVVFESYKREVITKIVKIFSVIQRSKIGGQNDVPQNQNSNTSKIIPGCLPKERKRFKKIIQNSMIKWLNFADEYNTSSNIFDILLQFDEKSKESSVETLEGNISGLCFKTLPYFTHLDDETGMEDLKQNIILLKTKSIETGASNDMRDKFYKENINSIYSLISLLTKVHILIDSREDIIHPNYPELIANFVKSSYTCL